MHKKLMRIYRTRKKDTERKYCMLHASSPSVPFYQNAPSPQDLSTKPIFSPSVERLRVHHFGVHESNKHIRPRLWLSQPPSPPHPWVTPAASVRPCGQPTSCAAPLSVAYAAL